jgi:peptidoglycan/LPS O-acetylase OafA/YrhL
VDVFFVISGYLITDQLYRELSTSGRVNFGAFYARRARRLLPSASLVIVATLAVSAVVLPPLEVAGVARDAISGAFYFANYRFAAEATNYLAGGSTSPFLHYWSLGVEEQFYLVWPLLLVLCSLPWLGRRRPKTPARLERGCGEGCLGRRDGKARVFVGLAIVGAASFALSLFLTRVDPPWAFFSLPTRAWELAAGGLVALAAAVIRRLPASMAALIGWIGVAGIGWAVAGLHPATPFPGVAAVIPVAGTMAVIAGGEVSSGRSPHLRPDPHVRPRPLPGARPLPGPHLLLGRRPLQFLGGVSYTWYLWHWPALVLAPLILGHLLSVPGRLVAVAASLALAVVTTVLVERPAQRASWLTARPARSLLFGGVLGCCSVATALVAVNMSPIVVGKSRATAVKLALPPAAALRKASPPPTAAARKVSPALAAARVLTAEANQAVRRSLAMKDVPVNLNPPISVVASGAGMATPFWDGCFDGFTDAAVNPCNYGDVGARRTIVLFGDSHALMWFPAFDKIALANHWHLVAQAKATCPPIDVPVFSPDLGYWYVQCDAWRAAVVARIRELRPAIVVLGFSREYGISNDHVDVDGPAWMGGLTKMIRTLRSFGSRVVVMGDVPYPAEVVPDCLSAHPTDLSVCQIRKRLPRFNAAGVVEEQRVVERAGAGYIDTEPWFCGPTRCAVVIGDKIVYHDDNHISASFAAWLTPVISADLRLVTPAHLWPHSPS